MADTQNFVGYKAKYQLCFGVQRGEDGVTMESYSFWIDLDKGVARIDTQVLPAHLQSLEPATIPGFGFTETNEAEDTLLALKENQPKVLERRMERVKKWEPLQDAYQRKLQKDLHYAGGKTHHGPASAGSHGGLVVARS